MPDDPSAQSDDLFGPSDDFPTVPDSSFGGQVPSKDPMIGLTIGQYTISSVIGSGGMGTVYRASQRSPRRTVAIKVLKNGLSSPKAVRRFEFESQLLARLRHPGIAQVYEAQAEASSEIKRGIAAVAAKQETATAQMRAECEGMLRSVSKAIDQQEANARLMNQELKHIEVRAFSCPARLLPTLTITLKRTARLTTMDEPHRRRRWRR